MRNKTLLLFAIAIVISPTLSAQNTKIINDDKWCNTDNNNYLYNGKKSEKHCEVREITIPAGRDVIEINGGQNGGVIVEAWDKNEILIRARVNAWARSEEDAYDLAQTINIETRNTIQTNRFRKDKYKNASVSYQIFVPSNSNLDVTTHNGGVAISDVSGDINFDVLNGGAKLVNLSGEVTGHTTNGGLQIQLSGTEWDGEKMDVETTNGGVVLYVPEDYNAVLHTGTVNGGINLDFPVSVKGSLRRNMKVTLGDGGKPVMAHTTNGGVRVRRNTGRFSKL